MAEERNGSIPAGYRQSYPSGNQCAGSDQVLKSYPERSEMLGVADDLNAIKARVNRLRKHYEKNHKYTGEGYKERDPGYDAYKAVLDAIAAAEQVTRTVVALHLTER